MRLFLLPISTRRTLIYCQRLNLKVSEPKTVVDKATVRAAALWASWEKKESGWQKKIVDFGNNALKRIPYEEWGLKSIPPLTARIKEKRTTGSEKIEVSFPSKFIPESKVFDVLKALGTERQGLHKSRMIYCFIGMPISAPVALLPVIPNLPFFYLVYRAWSHWRALSGSKHVMLLLDRKLIAPEPSTILDTLYSAGSVRAVPDGSTISAIPVAPSQLLDSNTGDGMPKEVMLLDKSNAPLIAQALELPELEVELERAIWQVESSMKSKQELQEEKQELNKAEETAQKETQEGAQTRK